MTSQNWILLAILGFIVSPTIGSVVIGLFVFNYVTDIIYSLWKRIR